MFFKKNLKSKLEKYLKDNLEVSKSRKTVNKEKMFLKPEEECFECGDAPVFAKCININTFIDDNIDDDTFQTKLFKIIDDKGLKDSDVYNKVNIDRRLFSKIRSNVDYHPSKETVILLGIALELDEEEIEDLLSSASYSLPMNTKYDLIIRFCFKEHIYNINQINEFLYEHNCKTLN